MLRILKKIANNDDKKKKFADFKSFIGWDLQDHYDQITSVYDQYANPFWYYETIIDELLRIEKLSIVPLYELMSVNGNGKRIIGIRHDIDMDPEAGLRCARYLAMKGICGSFYLLHTSPYYGVFYENCFVRNPKLREWVIGFVAAGCEIGLHNDCLQIYREYNKDGASAIIQEISWLRSLGAIIRGTVAHNSGPLYGAENYEIFKGRKLWDRNIVFDRKRIPLGILSEDELGLTYEGAFARPKPVPDKLRAANFFADSASSDVHSAEWMQKFLLDNPACDYSTDFQFWLIGKDKWAIAGCQNEEKVFIWEATLVKVLDMVSKLSEGTRSLFVIHPEYVRGNLSHAK